jgi:hypothetical protein
MTRFWILTTCAFLLLYATGCAPSPENIVAKYLENIINGEIEGAMKLCSGDIKEETKNLVYVHMSKKGLNVINLTGWEDVQPMLKYETRLAKRFGHIDVIVSYDEGFLSFTYTLKRTLLSWKIVEGPIPQDVIFKIHIATYRRPTDEKRLRLLMDATAFDE